MIENRNNPLTKEELDVMMALMEKNHHAYTEYDVQLNKPWKKMTKTERIAIKHLIKAYSYPMEEAMVRLLYHPDEALLQQLYECFCCCQMDEVWGRSFLFNFVWNTESSEKSFWTTWKWMKRLKWLF